MFIVKCETINKYKVCARGRKLCLTISLMQQILCEVTKLFLAKLILPAFFLLSLYILLNFAQIANNIK